MKHNAFLILVITSLSLAYSCSSRKNSNQMAKEANDQKIDNQQETTATDTKGDAKDATGYMVDLANTGRTEYELSQLAQERATNAGVKEYARQTTSMHSRDEAELKAEAQHYLTNNTVSRQSGYGQQTTR
jgi:putative membrane protein